MRSSSSCQDIKEAKLSENERISIEKELAFHGAPTLLGVKCASLISFDTGEETIAEYLRNIRGKLSGSGLCAVQMCKCRKRTLVYIYNRRMLAAWLKMPEVADFLAEYGYSPDMSTETMLWQLAGRISCGSFPHEIGAFLGYPVGDIRGFISNSGRNCLLCGYWKVYGNEEAARRTFAEFDRCRELLSARVNSGADLFRAVNSKHY